MTRILVASIVNQDPKVFEAFLDCIKWQTGNFDVSRYFLFDPSMPDDQTAALVEIANRHHALVGEADPKPEGAEYAVTDKTHHWTVPVFYWLGQQKQKLIEYARDNRFDALWLIDSDLLCSPDTLSSLWSTKKDVVSGVFYTKWQTDAPALPQVWMQHPYEFQGRGIEAHEFLGSLADRQVVRVAGLGACTLIRAAMLDRVAFWPLVPNLPERGMWQGEDRHFCITAERNHVELWADAWPDIWHCYRPEQRSSIAAISVALEYANAPRSCGPQVGDLVSFTIEPLEEPQIAGYTEHVRGRLGAIKMLPQIEEELKTMRAGDERLMRVQFPLWYPVPNYRGRTKLLRVKLLHVKPLALHPTEGDGAGTVANYFMKQDAA